MYDRLRNRTFNSSPSQDYITVDPEQYSQAVASLSRVGFVI